MLPRVLCRAGASLTLIWFVAQTGFRLQSEILNLLFTRVCRGEVEVPLFDQVRSHRHLASNLAWPWQVLTSEFGFPLRLADSWLCDSAFQQQRGVPTARLRDTAEPGIPALGPCHHHRFCHRPVRPNDGTAAVQGQWSPPISPRTTNVHTSESRDVVYLCGCRCTCAILSCE